MVGESRAALIGPRNGRESPRLPMNKTQAIQLLLALGLLAGAFAVFVELRPAPENANRQAFFYDESEQKLFVAPGDSIPPIHGLHSPEMVSMRAIVISANGDPKDKAARKVAYLEKYSPQLKQQLEEMQAGNRAAAPPREARQSQILVRRLSDTAWYPVNSTEGESITTEWQVTGPDGRTPVVCPPSTP